MRGSRERLHAWLNADWGVLLRCLWVIPAVEVSVRWRGPRSWLPPPTASAEPTPHDPRGSLKGQEIARWVDAAYRRSPFRPTCLTRSLVLYRILRARRIPCRLQVGLRKGFARLEGHAWVEAGKAAEAAGYEVVLSF